MNEIRFDTGLKTYPVNDTGVSISFNPADADFAHRLYTALNNLSAMQQEEEPENMSEIEVWEAVQTKDKAARAELDGLFGAGKADEIFPNVSVLALAGGLPLWANFLIAVVNEIDSSIKEELQKTDARVKALNAKYGGYIEKYGKKK